MPGNFNPYHLLAIALMSTGKCNPATSVDVQVSKTDTHIILRIHTPNIKYTILTLRPNRELVIDIKNSLIGQSLAYISGNPPESQEVVMIPPDADIGNIESTIVNNELIVRFGRIIESQTIYIRPNPISGTYNNIV